MDYNIKNALYASVGVREYRIVDPAKERTTIYYYEQDAAPMIIPFHQEVISGIYKNLKIKIADLSMEHDINFVWRKNSVFVDYYQQLFKLF